MILETGDMWEIWGKTDLFCITTNSTVKPDGRLVMGAGIAQEARDSIIGLDARLGRMIGFNHRPYGLLVLQDLARYKVLQPRFGALQVKYSFSQPADINLICSSLASLFIYIAKNCNCRVDMNMPLEAGSNSALGVGYGNLTVEEVWPIVSLLPDNVHVWCDDRTNILVAKMLYVVDLVVL